MTTASRLLALTLLAFSVSASCSSTKSATEEPYERNLMEWTSKITCSKVFIQLEPGQTKQTLLSCGSQISEISQTSSRPEALDKLTFKIVEGGEDQCTIAYEIHNPTSTPISLDVRVFPYKSARPCEEKSDS